jgi:hypothetical protein
MATKVTIENLDTAIQGILQEYEDDVSANLDEITRKIGKTGVKALNNASKSNFDGNKYNKSWTSTAEKGRLYTTVTLHSKLPGLPHLLEHGHAKVNGGRVKGRTHIEPVEQKLVKEYEREVKAKL